MADVVIVHLVEPEHAGPQAEVTMQRRQRLVYLLNERVINSRRNIVVEQLTMQYAVVVACLGEAGLGLHVRIQHHADRVAVFLPLAPERVEGELAVITILAAANASVSLGIDANFLSVGQGNGWPRDIRVGDEPVDIERRTKRL